MVFDSYKHGVTGLGRKLSRVAAIIDKNGGLRVLVDSDMRYLRRRKTVLRGEKVFVVPGILIQEPVPWNQVPWVIATARRYAEHCISRRNEPFKTFLTKEDVE